MSIDGYEIHMGETTGRTNSWPFQIIERSKKPSADPDGCLSADGNVADTYIHGLFHNKGFRQAILRELAERKGIIFFPADCVFSTQDEYDGLAALVRGNLDMSLIFRLLEHS